MKSSEFILGETAYKNAKKSLQSLIKQYNNQPETINTPPPPADDDDDDETSTPIPTNNQGMAIHLVISIKIPLSRKKDYIPRIIPISYKLDDVTNKSILLITKDPSTPYRSKLMIKDSPTEDLFLDIISFKKLKSMINKTSTSSTNNKGKKQNLIKIFKNYDIIVCDHRIMKFLPNLLGELFYYKNKKLPFLIQMAKPILLETSKLKAQLKAKSNNNNNNNNNQQGPSILDGLTISKENKIKDERCDPKYINLQIKSIVKNTNYLPSNVINKGDCISLKIGYINWSIDKLLININDIIDYLINKEYFSTIGGGGEGIIKDLNNLGNIHVKTNQSISLPIIDNNGMPKGNNDGEEEEDSDFDF